MQLPGGLAEGFMGGALLQQGSGLAGAFRLPPGDSGPHCCIGIGKDPGGAFRLPPGDSGPHCCIGIGSDPGGAFRLPPGDSGPHGCIGIGIGTDTGGAVSCQTVVTTTGDSGIDLRRMNGSLGVSLGVAPGVEVNLEEEGPAGD